MNQAIALVTGATDGIGRATAHALAARGYRVIVHGREAARVEQARAEISGRAGGAAVGACVADLLDERAVRAAAARVVEEYPRLDLLVNNAGAFFPSRRESVQGHEATLAVNHLAHFLLTHLLLPSLRAAPAARVVNVSSMAHGSGRIDLDDLHLTRRYGGREAYAAAKLANVLFTAELARRLGPAATVTVNALHPGIIATKLLDTGFPGLGGLPVDDGIKTTLLVATDPALAGVTGRYFSGGRAVEPSRAARDPVLQGAFYDASAALVGVTPLPAE